jgi:hypothetical protein
MKPYDPKTDGSVFFWILQAAQEERERRQSVADYVRFRQGLVKNANAARLRSVG